MMYALVTAALILADALRSPASRVDTYPKNPNIDANGNATTADFRRAMEEASGQELGWFFEQWLEKPGTLKVAGSWRYDAAAKQVQVTLDQRQADGSLFTMPIEIGLYAAGQPAPTIQRVRLTGKSNVFSFSVSAEPQEVRLDPNLWVLMDATFEKRGRP